MASDTLALNWCHLFLAEDQKGLVRSDTRLRGFLPFGFRPSVALPTGAVVRN